MIGLAHSSPSGKTSLVIETPDDVLWRWLELRAELSSPPGCDLVADTGLGFADACPRCGLADSLTEHSKKGPGGKTATAYRCGACQAPWPVEIRFLLRNEFFSSPRPAAIEPQLIELGRLAAILSKLTMREQRVYLALYVFEGIRNLEELAKQAGERWPSMRPLNSGRARGGWSEWAARKTVESARRKIRDAGMAAGLWRVAV